MAKTRIGYTIQPMEKLRFFLFDSDTHGERSFFYFMTAVLLGMYVWSIATSPDLRHPLPLTVFTVLLFAHLALHGAIFSLQDRPRWHVSYFFLQGLLVLPIVYLSGNIGMIFSTYLALIGESIGVLRGRKWQQVGVVGYNIVLAVLSFGFLTGWGGIQWSLVGILPMTVFVIMYVSLYSRQSEARQQAQTLAAELEAANRQLTEYAARVEDLTISTERQRMARELHDTLSQGLAGLILQLEAADAHLAQDHAEKARSIVANAMQQARTTLAEARHVIDDLRQPALDDLEAALRLEVSHFNHATGIPCDFHAEHTPPLPAPVRETVLRVAAEALSNIANHARAHAAQLDLSIRDQQLLVTIHDDGVGFDAAAIPSGHYGLLGIRERVRLAAGSFDIQSGNDLGTTLKIRIPL